LKKYFSKKLFLKNRFLKMAPGWRVPDTACRGHHFQFMAQPLRQTDAGGGAAGRQIRKQKGTDSRDSREKNNLQDTQAKGDSEIHLRGSACCCAGFSFVVSLLPGMVLFVALPVVAGLVAFTLR
jgi:hypothetical protein